MLSNDTSSSTFTFKKKSRLTHVSRGSTDITWPRVGVHGVHGCRPHLLPAPLRRVSAFGFQPVRDLLHKPVPYLAQGRERQGLIELSVIQLTAPSLPTHILLRENPEMVPLRCCVSIRPPHMHVCMHMCACVRTCVCTHDHVRAHCTCVHTYEHACVHLCMCACPAAHE